MRIEFIPTSTDGECRCQKCKKLLAKIKNVDSFASIEIKCTRAHCGLVNTFEIRRNKPLKNEKL